MSWFIKVLKEPLLHFLMIGAGLFLLYGVMQGPAVAAPDRIVVTEGRIEQLVANFTRTWMRPPNEVGLADLIDGYIRDELYYREAVALGLDNDDPVIRRRLRQKLGLLFDDMSAQIEPTDAELADYLQSNLEAFRLEPEVSFRQIYFNPDRRNDPEKDALAARQALRAGAPVDGFGDPAIGKESFSLATQTELYAQFGTRFAQLVLKQDPGGWSEPLPSALGIHLVQVSERKEARDPELAEVRKAVELEWLAQKRRDVEDATYRQLLEGYELIIEEPAKPELAAAVTMVKVAAVRNE
jgi:hypothetical protein